VICLKPIIIAEAGVNHNGSIELAKDLVAIAADAGADFVKFQTFITENNITKNAEKADYQKKQTNSNESQYEMIKKLELSIADHLELIKHCDLKGIKFLSTAFDIQSVNLLNEFNIPFYKIPSGEITNFPLLKYIGSMGKSIVMSTGMSDLNEIGSAINVLIDSGTKKEDLTILHCNTEYPTPYEDVNLRAMISIRNKFQIKVGYSDHTLGIEVPIAAVALGAEIIEKHFTIDRALPGPDHAASLEPNELKSMVKSIKNIQIALGNGVKIASKSELKNIAIARKSIVAKTVIKKGEIFSESNITIKRPGTGISPMKWNDIINKCSDRDYKEDDLIEL